MRAERGDDAATVTDAEEEKSPNVTCTTTWRREADVHYVKDVVFSYFKPAIMMHRFEGALNPNKGSSHYLFVFFYCPRIKFLGYDSSMMVLLNWG